MKPFKAFKLPGLPGLPRLPRLPRLPLRLPLPLPLPVPLPLPLPLPIALSLATLSRTGSGLAAAPKPRRGAGVAPCPDWHLLGTEPWRAALEFASHPWFGGPALAEPAQGLASAGHRVILFPGLASDGQALAPLRAHCAALGYRASDWGRGLNTGPERDFDAWLGPLAAEVLQQLAADADADAAAGCSAPTSVTLIGWSLGGIYARELAKRPELARRVRHVITIGTPFNGRANSTHAGWLLERFAAGQPALDAALLARLRQPPPQPTTSIYSRSDGIVAWQACRHRDADRRRHAALWQEEVVGSHLGMGWNPVVLQAVTQALLRAAPPAPPQGGRGRAACHARRPANRRLQP